MDDRKFDSLAKRIGAGSRRGFLKSAFGMATVAVAGGALTGDVEAARRGYSSPSPRPTPPPDQHYCTPDGTCCVECTPFSLGRFQNCYSSRILCTNPNDSCCDICSDWAGSCVETSS
jgi:hypothetical protein